MGGAFYYLVIGLVMATTLGCDDRGSDGGGRCVPGMSVACACSSGRTGAQTCLADGTFGTCECDSMPARDGSAGAADGSLPDAASAGDGGIASRYVLACFMGDRVTCVDAETGMFTTGEDGYYVGPRCNHLEPSETGYVPACYTRGTEVIMGCGLPGAAAPVDGVTLTCDLIMCDRTPC